MATYLENLTTARAQVAELLVKITANPKPTYSVGNQNISWESYFGMLTDKLEVLDKAIQRANGPFQASHRGRF